MTEHEKVTKYICIAFVICTGLLVSAAYGSSSYDSWTKLETVRVLASPMAKDIAKSNADRAMFEHMQASAPKDTTK